VAPDEQVQRAAYALEISGFRVLIAENKEEAEKLLSALLPKGTEIFRAAPQTLAGLDVAAEPPRSGFFDLVRSTLTKMDSQIQNRAMPEPGAAPEHISGSVWVLLETWAVRVASNTGSPPAPHATGVTRVLRVVGAQKIASGFKGVKYPGINALGCWLLPELPGGSLEWHARHQRYFGRAPTLVDSSDQTAFNILRGDPSSQLPMFSCECSVGQPGGCRSRVEEIPAHLFHPGTVSRG